MMQKLFTMACLLALVSLPVHAELRATNAIITGAITATSGDITAALAAGSITTTHIAANTILAGDIAANTITAAEIAANAIEASEIAANAVTASKISVSTLSAITANLGTITAGSISGVTATFGSNVTLDSSGMTLTAGTGETNKIKWSDGSTVYSFSDEVHIGGSANIQLHGGATGNAIVDSNVFYPQNNNDMDLGTSSLRWRKLFANDARLGNLTGTGNDYVCVDANGDLFRSDSAC